MLTALVASAVVVKPGVSAPERTPEFHFIAAEHASLTGTAQTSGTAVWIYSGLATWDVITREGDYRLFLRVRTGWSGNHKSDPPPEMNPFFQW